MYENTSFYYCDYGILGYKNSPLFEILISNFYQHFSLINNCYHCQNIDEYLTALIS